MLTIEEAVARVPQWGRAAGVSAAPLPGGITNVTYRVEVSGESFVVHLAGGRTDLLGIDRDRAYRCARAAGQAGVGPAVVYASPADGILVTRFVPGRCLTAADLARPETLGRVVRSLQRCHALPFPGQFSPFRTVEEYLRVARRHGAPLPDDIDRVTAEIMAIESAIAPGRTAARSCHNDLWSPNLLDDGDQVRVIDWDYAGLGDVYFDLANLAMHHRFTDVQDEALLRAYLGTASAAGLARLRVLRIVAEMREAMWAMVALNLDLPVQSGFDCLEYAGTHFDRCRRAMADPRLADWLDRAATHA